MSNLRDTLELIGISVRSMQAESTRTAESRTTFITFFLRVVQEIMMEFSIVLMVSDLPMQGELLMRQIRILCQVPQHIPILDRLG